MAPTVLGTRMLSPWPAGSAVAVFGMGASGGSSGCSGGCRECTRRRRATPAATPQPHLRTGLHRTHRPCRVVLVVFHPSKVGYDQLLRTSSRTTTRPRASGRATTAAASTDRPFTPHRTTRAASGTPAGTPTRWHCGRPVRPHHHRDRSADESSTTPRAITSSIWTRTLRLLQHTRHGGSPVRSRGRPAWVSKLTDVWRNGGHSRAIGVTSPQPAPAASVWRLLVFGMPQ